MPEPPEFRSSWANDEPGIPRGAWDPGLCAACVACAYVLRGADGARRARSGGGDAPDAWRLGDLECAVEFAVAGGELGGLGELAVAAAEVALADL
jgi:hypothetical protein